MNVRNPICVHYFHDMARAKRFYVEFFGVSIHFESPGWTTLNLGAIELALYLLPAGNDRPLPNAGPNLEVDHIAEIQAKVQAHGGRRKQLCEPNAGVPVRAASFEDSEGNGFEWRQQPWRMPCIEKRVGR